MSHYDAYTEAGQSSQIASSIIGINQPSSIYSFDIRDDPLTPNESISQQPLYTLPPSDVLDANVNPIPSTLRRISPRNQKHWVL